MECRISLEPAVEMVSEDGFEPLFIVEEQIKNIS